jgi:hypothetical protein
MENKNKNIFDIFPEKYIQMQKTIENDFNRLNKDRRAKNDKKSRKKQRFEFFSDKYEKMSKKVKGDGKRSVYEEK